MDTAFQELLKTDLRYKLEAYRFVFESLDYSQKRMKLGKKCKSESAQHTSEDMTEPQNPPQDDAQEEPPENHVSGQELCLAARSNALDLYGLMAKTVLESWGIRSTSDIGEMVYNLIRIGRMRKTPEDRREDFDDVYNFNTAFDDEYQITLPKKRRKS